MYHSNMNKERHRSMGVDLRLFFRRLKAFLKRKGFKGILEKLKILSQKKDILNKYSFIMQEDTFPFDSLAYSRCKPSDTILLNWVIPEMGEGSGGHTTIFRFVSNLEKRGFHSRIYLYRSENYKDSDSVKKFLGDKFPILDKKVEVYYDVKYISFAHATFATSWETAYFVKRYENTISKFYFVQDFEPYFFPQGSFYEFAKKTYSFGLRGITAGSWLENKLRDEFGMVTDSFSFSYQKDIYKPMKKDDDKKRIFFYARPVTARRDFELGLLALNKVCSVRKDIEVIFAGWDIREYNIPFKYENLGIVSAEVLAETYARCDMCLVISNTNLSLVPLEVMGAGSVAICTRGDNSTWLVNDSNAILVNYDPIEIADTIEYYFAHMNELEEIREKGMAFAARTSWSAEADKVADIIRKAIKEDMMKIE